MSQKEEFINKMKSRTKQFGVDIIKFCENMKNTKATSVITYQIIKSATSTGVNYRAACEARSKSEFFSKICIVTEEVDETNYWLEIIRDTDLSKEEQELDRLLKESVELTKIISKAKHTSYTSLNH